MRLIFDEYEGIWVWVEDHDENIELSPHFDEEHDALQWQKHMKKIFTGHSQDKRER